jgi:hypothetical protein
MAAALTAAGYNVSAGDDLVPNGALIGDFVCNYHPTIAGVTQGGMVRAGVEVRIVTDRADEGSARHRIDDALSSVFVVLEKATGRWHSLTVQTSRPDSPLTVGEASYASAALIVEIYV